MRNLRFRPAAEPLEPRCALSAPGASLLRHAYGLTIAGRGLGAAGRGAGSTVAIVVAYNDPAVRHELAAYSRAEHLAPARLSVFDLASPGSAVATGWDLEAAIDTQMVHAMAPRARIDLVEAANDGAAALTAAEAYAAALPGVDVVSNSWDAPLSEFPGSPEPPAWHNPAVAFVAASGDAPGLQYPATCPDVITVGATAGAGWGAQASSASGGGLMPGPVPPWQAPLGRPGRSVPDVALTGTAMVDFGQISPFHGTSIAAPLFAGLLAVADAVRFREGRGQLGTDAVLAALYGTIGTPAYGACFMDVTAGPGAGPGDDLATGLGQPWAPGLIQLLSGLG